MIFKQHILILSDRSAVLFPHEEEKSITVETPYHLIALLSQLKSFPLAVFINTQGIQVDQTFLPPMSWIDRILYLQRFKEAKTANKELAEISWVMPDIQYITTYKPDQILNKWLKSIKWPITGFYLLPIEGTTVLNFLTSKWNQQKCLNILITSHGNNGIRQTVFWKKHLILTRLLPGTEENPHKISQDVTLTIAYIYRQQHFKKLPVNIFSTIDIEEYLGRKVHYIKDMNGDDLFCKVLQKTFLMRRRFLISNFNSQWNRYRYFIYGLGVSLAVSITAGTYTATKYIDLQKQQKILHKMQISHAHQVKQTTVLHQQTLPYIETLKQKSQPLQSLRESISLYHNLRSYFFDPLPVLSHIAALRSHDMYVEKLKWMRDETGATFTFILKWRENSLSAEQTREEFTNFIKIISEKHPSFKIISAIPPFSEPCKKPLIGYKKGNQIHFQEINKAGKIIIKVLG